MQIIALIFKIFLVTSELKLMRSKRQMNWRMWVVVMAHKKYQLRLSPLCSVKCRCTPTPEQVTTNRRDACFAPVDLGFEIHRFLYENSKTGSALTIYFCPARRTLAPGVWRSAAAQAPLRGCRTFWSRSVKRSIRSSGELQAVFM